ncbi:MAG: hypothetical protein CVV02_13310 [Firmicutes bacterium HGW-Firmicutes-7]|nr:MAG: hypothetical protein CVV02_13310 [Firmicutes bacterium HGW-Firmicutes-7]
MRKSFYLFLAIIMCLSYISMTVFATGDDVSVRIDGELIEFDQPPLIVNGRTLIPIRAVCEKIGATVEWDDRTKTALITKDDTTIKLQIGRYDMQVSDQSSIYLDVVPQIYNGRTLMPIRAIAEGLGCEVLWNEANRTIEIEQSGTIIVHGLWGTQVSGVTNWAGISSVQQFAYKDDGLAYAYVKDNTLIITTPTTKINIEMKYPKLGDVNSDNNGNFYIIWGREGDVNTDQTIFISKYAPDGTHIKTTGFTGESVMGEEGNTQIPFIAGTCVSTIGNGYLMVNYGRIMYNKHQSNSVIGVKISDMSPVEWDSKWDIPYTSHSFNQSIIWSEKTEDFVYADHGDAYGRGFVINTNDNGKLLFHFYLEANANYNMYIVNKTFAQLGGLAETSKGIALVGASAKSISEEVKNEKQNLFVQIFDPQAEKISSSMFTGGTTRSGALSIDINDNRNSPLTNVTDYGVHWLTDYTDTDVIAPQVVSADGKVVILWSTDKDALYMVVAASGEVITPATSLGGIPLNSYERPIYYNGFVYWVSVNDGRLKIRSIKI